MAPKKRQADASSSPAKRRKVTLATEPIHVLGEAPFADWPAPKGQLERARAFIKDCAAGSFDTILVPDKDADGLSSALVLKRTLMLLGLEEGQIHVHLPRRGIGMFSTDHRTSLEEQCTALGGADKARVIVLDQGSRPGPALVRDIPYLILDHHVSTTWPDGSIHVTGCDAQPVPTSSLLAYIVCYPLHPDVPTRCDWPALIGIFGDLGSTEIAFGNEEGIWPVSKEMLQLGAAQKRETKKGLSEAVSLLNAPRRTAEFNVIDAWKALDTAKGPGDISNHPQLKLARLRIRDEHERCNHAAPKFSKDGRVALLRIDSAFQVHPLVATSWSGTLRGAKKLEMIMCANPGHHPDPDIISFSCRMAQRVRALPADERPSLIELLREYGRKTSETFMTDVGGDFASGHREATGGIILKTLFEQFCEVGMEIGVKPDVDPNAPPRKPKKNELEVGQRTLGGFFSSPVKKESSPAKAEVIA